MSYRSMHWSGRACVRGICAILLLSLLGILSQTSAGAASAQVKRGGSLEALELSSFSGTWTTLDPITDTDASANATMLNAIYGELFEQGPGGSLQGDLASGFKLSADGLTASIFLRHGVVFQDGTPFNAAAVEFNLERDLEPQYTCVCRLSWPLKSISTDGPYTVVLHLKTPYAPIFASFLSSPPNWIVSPTALQKLGTTSFGKMPVGAGPFQVVSDRLDAQVQLKANPHYWHKGQPYLSKLTFMSIGDDASAIDGLLTNQAQVFEDLHPVFLAASQAKQLSACNPPSVEVLYVALNSLAKPFNNPVAREALSYATDPDPILKTIYQNKGQLTESPTGPAGLFYEQKVPGYRSYDLAKAKQLVQQLGGLHVDLSEVQSTTEDETAIALKSEWSRAGIATTIDQVTSTGLLQLNQRGTWNATVAAMGAYDPAIVPGFAFHFSSAFDHEASGTNDTHLDQLLNEAASALSNAKRAALYKQAYEYAAQKSYGLFMFSLPSALVTTKSVQGVPCSTVLGSIHWQTVSV